MKPTWEPLEELLETTALDCYEERHGLIYAVWSPNGRLVEGGDNVMGCPIESSSSSPRSMTMPFEAIVDMREPRPRARAHVHWHDDGPCSTSR